MVSSSTVPSFFSSRTVRPPSRFPVGTAAAVPEGAFSPPTAACPSPLASGPGTSRPGSRNSSPVTARAAAVPRTALMAPPPVFFRSPPMVPPSLSRWYRICAPPKNKTGAPKPKARWSYSSLQLIRSGARCPRYTGGWCGQRRSSRTWRCSPASSSPRPGGPHSRRWPGPWPGYSPPHPAEP